MRTERVSIRLANAAGLPGSLALREPCGRDELAIQGVDTAAALELLDRLLEPPLPGGAGGLNVTDRDALLAALHRQCWGDTIMATRTCGACQLPFDLSFQLSDLQRSLLENQVPPDPRWTLPTTAMELACGCASTASQAMQDLMETCDIEPADMEAAASSMEAAAPILDVDLEAPCPECGHAQWASFDLQSFLLQRFLGEREGLMDEIHFLAEAYGWSLREILTLTRQTRRSLTQRILDRASP